MENEADVEVVLQDENGNQESLEGEPQKEPVSFTFDEDEGNLVETFMGHPDGVEALKDIAEEVIANFEADHKATKEYRERAANDWKLFAGALPEKDFPFEECANAHVPIMLKTITRVAFRAFGELFPDWNNVFGVRSMGPPDDEVAKILTIHGNWQIREEIPDFKRQMHKGMLAFWAIGDVTCHSWYDRMLRQNRHEFLTPDDFVTPYTTSTMAPDYSDLPHYTKILRYYRHQLEAYKDFWYGVEEVLEEKPPSWDSDPERPLADAVAEAHGIDKDDSDGNGAYTLLWYEGWMDLPTQDRLRFCRAVVDQSTKGILELCILEEPNWKDVQRYERQQAELAQYRQARTAFQDSILRQHEQVQQLTQQLQAASPEMGPLQLGSANEGLQAAIRQMENAQAPPPPKWMKNPADDQETPDPPRKEPVRMFTHFVCIEPLAGNLGLSYGRIEADFNRAANTALSQFTDQATLGNAKCMIVAEGVEFPDGFSVGPGKKITVRIGAGDLKNNIMPLDFGQANPQLLELVKMMDEFGEAAAQSPGVLSGESGKSGETYRGISARIEQATKQLSVGTKKFADSLVYVLKNNARLNSKFLDEEELFRVVEPMLGQVQEFQVGRRMYERDYRVEVSADMRFASMAERIQEADEMLALPQKIQPLQGNIYFLYQALKKALEARGRTDMIAALGPPPPPPTTPLGLPPPPPPPPPGMPMPGPMSPPGNGAPAAPKPQPVPPQAA